MGMPLLQRVHMEPFSIRHAPNSLRALPIQYISLDHLNAHAMASQILQPSVDPGFTVAGCAGKDAAEVVWNGPCVA